MKIEVFYLSKCRSWQGMVSLLKKAVNELGISAQIITREIKDSQEAEKIGFLGSPTVKINGEDLEPGAYGNVLMA